VSDQDFFFDEEDEKPAKAAPKSSSKPAGKPAARKPAGKAAAAAPAAAATGSFFDQTVTMSIASLLVVCGLLVGLIGGVLIGQARANSVPGVDAAAAGAGGQAAQQAPQLTQDQLNSGQLPPGHPSIGAGGATGTAQPSQTATGK
jgi:hypothetical protein